MMKTGMTEEIILACLLHDTVHALIKVDHGYLYAFEPGVVIKIDPFIDIIGRHFKNPKESLGNDGSPVALMWRAIAMPDSPL